MGRSFSDNVASNKHESEDLHVRCRSPRRSASTITWRAMPNTTQGASIARDAEDWQNAMSESEMKKNFKQVMNFMQEVRLNPEKCPRSVLFSASSCRRIRAGANKSTKE